MAVLSRVRLFILHTQAENGVTDGIAPAFCDGIHIKHQPPACQTRVYRVMHLRTAGVHSRRYFQHAHFIPIVDVGKRGEY